MKIKYLEHTHNLKYKPTKYDDKFISDMSAKFPYANIRIIPYWYKFEIDGEIYYSSQVYRKVGSLDKYRETKYANMMKKAEKDIISDYSSLSPRLINNLDNISNKLDNTEYSVNDKINKLCELLICDKNDYIIDYKSDEN